MKTLLYMIVAVCFIKLDGTVTAGPILAVQKYSSPNGAYEFSCDNRAGVYTMYASGQAEFPLWKFTEPPIIAPPRQFGYPSPLFGKHLLFVSNDGESVVIVDELTNLTPKDWSLRIRIIGKRREVKTYLVERDLTSRLPFVDIPVYELGERWALLTNVSHDIQRSGSMISISHFGALTNAIDLRTGEVVSRYPNPRYWFFMGLVYAVPVWVLAKYRSNRQKQKTRLAVVESPARELWNTQPLLIYFNTIIVIVIFGVFAVCCLVVKYRWKLPGSMRSTIWELAEPVCSLCCGITLCLIPIVALVTVIRRVKHDAPADFIAPWLATIGFVIIASEYYRTFNIEPYTFMSKIWYFVDVF